VTASSASSAAPDADAPSTASALPPDPAPAQVPPQRPPSASVPVGWVIVSALLALTALASLGLAWSTQTRMRALEETLVKRQQASQEQAAEARLAARQVQDVARESAARVALMELRVAESMLQRSQVEDLMQSVARSRDENVLADIEAALRVALQHSAITGSTEPLLAALQQADERLARHSQPPLERVRRAIAKDIERTRDVGVADIAALTLRLDEAIRAVDDLPLLSRPDRQPAAVRPTEAARPPAASASANAVAAEGDVSPWRALWQAWGVQVWQEVRSLVRVTRIDQPDAMLVAPEQAWFLRENLKLRLLNARLALLSRQFDTAQSDLRDARTALERYFDRNARGVQGVANTLRQVMAQARQVGVPRPDATLAAIAAAAAGR
jgi:uroporphyrin-III C-methyltransferase